MGGRGWTAVAPPRPGLVTEKHPPHYPALGPRIGLFPARPRPPPAFLGPGSLVPLCCCPSSRGLLAPARAACILLTPAALGFVWALDLPRAPHTHKHTILNTHACTHAHLPKGLYKLHYYAAYAVMGGCSDSRTSVLGFMRAWDVRAWAQRGVCPG